MGLSPAGNCTKVLGLQQAALSCSTKYRVTLSKGLFLPGRASHRLVTIPLSCLHIYKLDQGREGGWKQKKYCTDWKKSIFPLVDLTHTPKKSNFFEVSSWYFPYCWRGTLPSCWGPASEMLHMPAAYKNCVSWWQSPLLPSPLSLVLPITFWSVLVNFCEKSTHLLFLPPVCGADKVWARAVCCRSLLWAAQLRGLMSSVDRVGNKSCGQDQW